MHSSQKYFQKNNFENIFKKILKKKGGMHKVQKSFRKNVFFFIIYELLIL